MAVSSIPLPSAMQMHGDVCEKLELLQATWTNYEVAQRLDKDSMAIRVAPNTEVGGLLPHLSALTASRWRERQMEPKS